MAGIQITDIPKVGDVLRVTNGIQETADTKHLQTGDIVEVIGVYPHHIMVQRLKGMGWTGEHRIRQCYPIKSWVLNLERVK